MVAHKNLKTATTAKGPSGSGKSSSSSGGLDLSISGTKATSKASSGKGSGGFDLSVSGKKV